MAKLKMGYIGCGFMAQKVHIPNILSLENDCELVAIAEVREQLGAKVQHRWRIPRCYNSHLELTEDKTIQAVGVSGHFSGQGQIAIDLLNAGKDVLMEKPMAVSVEQAERILEAERKSGKRLMIAYMKRYDAGNVMVKNLLEQYRQSGEMGKLKFARNQGIVGEWTAGLDTPMDSADEPYPNPPTTLWPTWLPEQRQHHYFSYLQQWTHNVNLLRWFLESETNGTRVLHTTLDKDDGCTGVTVLDVGGVTTSLETGYLQCHEWNEHTQFFFENGWIKTEMPTLLLRNVPATVEVYRGDGADKSTTRYFPANGRSWSYKEEMQHFIHSIQEGTPFRSSAVDAMNDVKTIETIYKMHIDALA